ncbi:hypothetical protein N4G49_09875, partial [Riemerella anatipestifer]|uniref:hypothetical protein n=2 Tax=Riemerella anatipestifer TaxID=34085 RepID=UPI001C8785EF
SESISKTTTWNVGALVIQNQLLNLHFLFPLFFPQGFPKLITTGKVFAKGGTEMNLKFNSVQP